MSADVLAVFDLDHTLVPHDSDEEWVAFLVEEGALDRVHWDSANRDLIARFNRGEAGAIEFTEFYLSTLTHFDDATLSRLRERYLDVKIRPRIATEARALVERHRAAGDLIIVTTAVFRFLSDPIAAEFGIADVIATEAERLDGRYTGRVSGVPNTREGKFERLAHVPCCPRSAAHRFSRHLCLLRLDERSSSALAGVESGCGQRRSRALRACAAHGLAGDADRIARDSGVPMSARIIDGKARAERDDATKSTAR